MAMNLFLIRLDGTYARQTGVVSDPVFVNMTGKGEPYRDLPTLVHTPVQTGESTGNVDQETNTGLTLTSPTIVPMAGAGTIAYITGTLAAVEADDVSHTAPRQGDQDYTFWKFDFGVSAGNPQYVYAEFRRGDIIANTAPNTDPAV